MNGIIGWGGENNGHITPASPTNTSSMAPLLQIGTADELQRLGVNVAVKDGGQP